LTNLFLEQFMSLLCKAFRLSKLVRPTVAAALLCGSLAASAQPYRVVDSWKIGGDGGWDYLTVDSTAHRLYIARGARVDVVDTQSGKLAGSVGGLHGTHGVVLDPAGKVGYISDGAGNAVVVFDRSTLAIVATIAAGTNPDGILYEPSTKTVWAFNGKSHDVTVIDPAQQKAVATIALPGKPEFPAADGKGTVFVNIEDKGEIVRLDAKTQKATAEWPLTGCVSPTGLAFDVAGSRLFSVCDGSKMAVTDANTGKSLATPGIGDGPDAAGYSARFKLAFSSNGEGTLTVVDTAAKDYPSIQTLTTQKSARTMAYDAAADRIYVVAAEFGPKPAATVTNPHARANVLPGSFTVLVIGR
jgi:DNA-binding beta-propeller fold protein YncE